MSDYRSGDKVVGGYRLRLTVAGLAEIVDRLDADSPKALASRLRQADLDDWNDVFAAVANPRPETVLTDSQIADILPDLTDVIAKAFT